jgi:hypothetical protein
LAAKLDEDFIESCGSSVLQALPAGLSGCGFSPDTQAGMVKFAEVVPSPQIPGNVLNKPMAGQLFPRGAQNTGGSIPGVGQNFPY